MAYTPFNRFNSLQQDFDVSGSDYQNNNRWLTDETGGLGMPVILASGSAATITAFSTPSLTVGGLTGQSAASVGTLILLALTGESGNTGTFRVTSNTSASVDVVSDASGVFPDSNTGSISWAQFNSNIAASITTVTSGVATITGLVGMSANSVGRFLQVGGAASSGNNGTFLIVAFNSATSVGVANASAVATDGNNGAITWVERNPYVINDDLDFERTDRTAIKGVNYDQPIPFYSRPDAVGVNVPTSLKNVAGKTTDAKLLNANRIFYSQAVASTDTFVTVTSTGNLKHASSTDNTGVPCFDAAPYVGDYTSCFVEITSTANGDELFVIAGGHLGEKVFGVTEAGGSTSPNSVEVHFFSVPVGGDPTVSSTAYTWESTQATTVNLVYGFGERLDNLDLNALRSTPALGIVSDASLRQSVDDILSTAGWVDGTTDLSSSLTNQTSAFVFFNLPGGTADTVVSALNTLNTQIGNRTYTGPVLTSGQTIAASLQALSTAITATTVTRYIERLATAAPANTSHLLPGAATYTPDGTGNGKNLWVFWNGILRDPGTVATGDDYAETDSTHITPYSNIKAGQHVSYVVV